MASPPAAWHPASTRPPSLLSPAPWSPRYAVLPLGALPMAGRYNREGGANQEGLDLVSSQEPLSRPSVSASVEWEQGGEGQSCGWTAPWHSEGAWGTPLPSFRPGPGPWPWAFLSGVGGFSSPHPWGAGSHYPGVPLHRAGTFRVPGWFGIWVKAASQAFLSPWASKLGSLL